jgi:predicted nucleic acid-binding protein
MAHELTLLDTSILIDYFRKRNKSKSTFYQLYKGKQYSFAVSSITVYEIMVGASSDQKKFWSDLLTEFDIFSFNTEIAQTAARLQQQLIAKNEMIAIPDLFIGATAMYHHLKIATLNKKHFKRIADLEMVI